MCGKRERFKTRGFGKILIAFIRVWGGILVAFILVFFLCSSGYGNDAINLGLIERFEYFGAISCVEIYRDNSHNEIYAYLGTQEGLLIVDITDPNTPEKSTFLKMGKVKAIAFYQPDGPKNFAVVLKARGGIAILDLEDAAKPVYAGKYELIGKPEILSSKIEIYLNSETITTESAVSETGTSGTATLATQISIAREEGAQNIAISGHYAYVVDCFDGLVIIDLIDPTKPAYAGGYYTQGKAKDIAISDNHAYIADGANGLVIINITDPTNPFYAGGDTLAIEEWEADNQETDYIKDALGIAVDENHAYLTLWTKGLVIVDISDPSNPSYVNWLDTGGDALDVAISENFAYVANGQQGLVIIDVSDPNKPVETERRYDNSQEGAIDIAISGNCACMPDYQGKGFKILTIPKTDPATPAVYAGKYNTECYAQGMIISNGYGYMVEEKTGLTIINVKDPTEPGITGKYLTAGKAFDIDISGDHAYVADYDSGLAIIDITDPNNPVKAGQCPTTGNASGVKIFGDYAYVADIVNGLLIIDISDPNNPFITEEPDIPMKAYDIALSENGNYAYVADQDVGLQIFDISDPNNPLNTGNYPYQDAMVEDMLIHDNYVYMAAGAAGLLIIDVSDPADPQFAGKYENEAGIYGVSLCGDYAYVANNENGLAIIDIKDPNQPILYQAYDTPGAASGVVVYEKYAYVANAINGLFIFKIMDTPSAFGNLILCPSGPASVVNPLWPPTQALSNLAYTTFLDQNYPLHSIYYLNPNPNPYPDIDQVVSLDSPVVNTFDSSLDEFHYALTQWAPSSLNTGPLYLYLVGQGASDAFQIFPGEILLAEDPNNPDLKDGLDIYQEETGRDLICIMDFSSSGSFCDNLIDPNTKPYSRSIITSTDDGPAYFYSHASLSFIGRLFITILRNLNMPDFFSDTGISHLQRVKLLQAAFSIARKDFWASNNLLGNHAPQMVTARGPHTLCSITLSTNFNNSAFIYGDTNQIWITDPNYMIDLKATGHYLDGDQDLDCQVFYHSSDPAILSVTQKGQVYANPNTNYMGDAFILATIIDPNFIDPNLIQNLNLGNDFTLPPLGGVTGRIPINVAIAERREKENLPKAIIVAGRSNDPEGYDYLWDSTSRIANHAYNTFIDRNYSPENIYYLSHDPNQAGVDGPYSDSNQTFSTLLNELFTNPNNPYLNLKELTDLTIFLTGHGQKNRFMLGPEDDQFLTPDILDQWLDNLQSIYPSSKITVIIEAAFSESFIYSLLHEAQNRIVIASTQESAAFLEANGRISFSYFLFNYLKSGSNFAIAFEKAYKNIASLGLGGILHPILKDTQSRRLALQTSLGGLFLQSKIQPQIIQMSTFDDPNNPITPYQSVNLWAKVINLNNVEKVWAVINNSLSSLPFSASGEVPLAILNLPKVILVYNIVNDRHEGTYEGFSYPGPYTITFMTEDDQGIVSYPKTVHLNIEGPCKNIAFLIHDLNTGPYANFAQWVLRKRGFPENDIYKLQGVNNLPSALDSAIDPNDSINQLILFFISQEVLTSTQMEALDTQLDQIQQDTNCTIITLIDADDSGFFLPILKGEKRIIISSTDQNHQITTGYARPPFSQFFFSGIYNGVNVNLAYSMACLAIGPYSLQNPLLDDNGNGVGSEYGPDYDGQMAANIYLGSPFVAVPAGPWITVPSVVHINGWKTSTATIWAQAPDPNNLVWAHILPPEGPRDVTLLEYNGIADRFEAEYHWFTQKGSYEVVVYVQNQYGLLNYDITHYLVLKPDLYEVESDPNRLTAIMVNQAPQEHSFHDPNDQDLLHFYGYAALPYEITATKPWPDCQLKIEVFAPDGTLINQSPYTVGFTASETGFYTIRVSYTCPMLPMDYPGYTILVGCSSAGTGGIWGWVRDADTGAGLVGAQLCASEEQCVSSLDEWWSDDPNADITHTEAGFYFMDALPVVSGGLPISVQTEGYLPTGTVINDYHENLLNITFYLEWQNPNIPTPPDPEEIQNTINCLMQKKDEVRVDVILYKGLNFFSHPNSNPISPFYAANFLLSNEPDITPETSPTWFLGIKHFNISGNTFETCCFVLSPQGEWSIECSNNFPVASGENNTVYMIQTKTLHFPIPLPNPAIDLKKGINYIGIPSPPPEYNTYTMLQDIGGPEEVASIIGFNPLIGKQGHTYWNYNQPSGDNFPIQSGSGYMVYMKKDVVNWFPGATLPD